MARTAGPTVRPRGIVRLSREDMSELGVGAGALLSVSGDRVAYARAFPAAAPGPVGLDAVVVANAAPRGRLTVELKPVETAQARRVECQVLEGEAPARDSLVHFTVCAGDTLALGRGRNLRVVACTPDGPATITPETVVAFRAGAAAPREAGLAALAGLDAEIASLREIIEWPMRRPDLFARLGVDPPRSVLLSGPPGVGKTLLARAVAQDCGVTPFALSGLEIVGKYPDDAGLRALFERAAREAPSVMFIDDIDALSGLPGAVLSTLMDGLDPRRRVVVMAATHAPENLDSMLRRRFSREIALYPPDRDGRRAILALHTRLMPLGPDVDLDALAATTRGFVGADLAGLAREAGMAAIRRQPTHDLTVTRVDFQAARREVAPSAPRDISAEAPDIGFDAIGGLDDAKAALLQAVTPLAHADLCDEFGVRPSRNVLLAGPPGVGKTRLAHAMAHETGVAFLSLRGTEDASEAAIRRVFAQARRSAPVILFLDDIDAFAAKALRDAIDADVSGVFLLGATHNLDAVDPGLRRRFDAVVVTPPPDLDARRAIARIHAPWLGAPAFDRIAAASEGYVGADIAALCQRLGLAAMRRAVSGDRAPVSDAEIDAALARPEGA